MSDTVIKVEGLGKLYKLGEITTGTISHDLKRWWASVRGKEDPFAKVGTVNDRTANGTDDYVWALKDVNFEVKRGEALGIIGRNGAGKSTLLKLLSKVTSPTTGSIKVKGRLASLLEVGTGFHPELTGRENIFLNGAILGMTKAEIKSKFDEILDFAGVEKYIDTPVKRYSSGMYVRLAFAVAAHLEPEILIVDEVLAVGDAEFQKKCLGKMKDVSEHDGRTVLFVSHNMGAVKTLCTSGILMENGKITLYGIVDNVILKYLGSNKSSDAHHFIFEHINNDFFRLNEIIFKNANRSINEPLVENEAIEFTTNFLLDTEQPERYHITYHLANEYGEPLFSFGSSQETVFKKGNNSLTCIFPKNFFQSGNFHLSFYLVIDRKKAVLVEKDIVSFTVVDGEREIGVYMGREPGSIRPQFNWKIQ
jgi:lipopolysaccharide transport system ATP-binding protein